MNVFLLTDLEGIPGVTSIDQIPRDSEGYQTARKNLTFWLNRTAEICREQGAETVYYLDGHGGGRNVLLDEVDKSLIACSINDWCDLLKGGKIDCQIELGCHARAGTIGGFLDHTLSSKAFFSYKVNGVEQSELSLHAALCGAYGVPIVACIGDEVACAQAKEYIPEIVTGAVKIASCRNFCQEYPNPEEIIRTAVKGALELYQSTPPYRLEFPAVVELTLYRTDMCEEILEKKDPRVVRIDARTVQKTVSELTSYWDLRF